MWKRAGGTPLSGKTKDNTQLTQLTKTLTKEKQKEKKENKTNDIHLS